MVAHFFQALTKGVVIIQIGDAVFGEQKIRNVHIVASFLQADDRPYLASPAF